MKAMEQMRARELVRSALADAVVELKLELQRRIFEVQAALRDAVKAAHERELAAVRAAREELRRVLEADQRERERIRAAVRAELAQVAADQRVLEGALTILSGTAQRGEEVGDAR